MGGDPNGSPLVFLTIFIFFSLRRNLVGLEQSESRKSSNFLYGGDIMAFWKIREVFLEEDECVIIYK